LVIKALDPDWSPTSNAGSGSGSNEYESETLMQRLGTQGRFFSSELTGDEKVVKYLSN
jgi:hypothetical protein